MTCEICRRGNVEGRFDFELFLEFPLRREWQIGGCLESEVTDVSHTASGLSEGGGQE